MAPYRKPGYSDYLSEAFNAGLVIKGMGEIPVNKLFILGSFILGFSNPGFWFLGLALEFVYLWYLSSNPRFQKFVEGKQLAEIQQSRSSKMNEVIASLTPENHSRLKRLNASLAEINKLMNWNTDDGSGFMNTSKQATLNQLPSIFLKLLKTKQLIEESLHRTKANEIKSEIKKLEQQMTDDISPALAKSLQGNIEIHKKRLDNLSAAKENEMLVEMELQRIESQLQMVREGIALDSSPEAFSANIDHINNTLGETQNWINTHTDFLRKLSGPPIDEPVFESDSEPVIPPPTRETE
ncbi:MAG TPA: hypothetical protein PLK58_04500 [Candidatus Rifleibacterium sp.]|nr:hypothetical protein [Candidatus Ozemobacteraceae bacterium]HNW09950.1 hypothetical protein [Candidatus Rifleibacterium sp.]HPW57873.1 hypothetical protein [Candidatus Rifleibacterium sp.]